MSRRLGAWLGSTVVLLSLVRCKVDGQTSSGDHSNETTSDSSSRCAQLVDELRGARLGDDPPSLATQRSGLRDACDTGCGLACLEYARNSFEPGEVASFNQHACEHGEQRGCELASSLEVAAAGELCDAGEMLGCATLLRLGIGDADRLALEQRVLEAAAHACANDDGRACSIHAWTRCVGLGQCDAEALGAAQKGVRLLPEPEVIETLALVHCHAGQHEQADQQLVSACAAGSQDSCGRRCEVLGGSSLLVREARRASYDRIATLLLLQSDANESWYLTLSAMDEAELDGFQEILEAFTPPISKPASNIEVPADLREQFPALVEAIIRSPQLDAKQIRYWFARLPEMTDEQRGNLVESLRKQWWIVPGEEGRTPHAYIDRVRLHNGGFGPATSRGE